MNYVRDPLQVDVWPFDMTSANINLRGFDLWLIYGYQRGSKLMGVERKDEL